jgi:hypothetical protein
MNELWEDFVRRSQKKASCTIDYFACQNRQNTKSYEFMGTKCCKYELLERATTPYSHDVTFFELFKAMGTCMRVTNVFSDESTFHVSGNANRKLRSIWRATFHM